MARHIFCLLLTWLSICLWRKTRNEMFNLCPLIASRKCIPPDMPVLCGYIYVFQRHTRTRHTISFCHAQQISFTISYWTWRSFQMPVWRTMRSSIRWRGLKLRRRGTRVLNVSDVLTSHWWCHRSPWSSFGHSFPSFPWGLWKKAPPCSTSLTESNNPLRKGTFDVAPRVTRLTWAFSPTLALLLPLQPSH